MKKIESLVLIIYTLFTLRFLWPFLFNGNNTIFATALGEKSGVAFLSLFIGSFLNAFLIIYWINKKHGNI